jgi:hemerythrin superfamily protein
MNGRSPDEIEGDIENTRAELGRTLDALQSRLSPRERLQAATDSARDMGERVLHSASRSMQPSITTMIRMDHTHVLALFRRFRPWTSNSRKQALMTNACIALEIHAQLEEEIFYPALRQTIGSSGSGSEVLEKSEPEHNQMRELINALRSMEVGGPSYDDTVHMLMRTVLHHVADEESILLPQAEEMMSDRLGELGMQMTRRRVELLRPHLGEVAVTTAQSFPVATAALGVGLVALAWMLFRPTRSRSRSLVSRYVH